MRTSLVSKKYRFAIIVGILFIALIISATCLLSRIESRRVALNHGVYFEEYWQINLPDDMILLCEEYAPFIDGNIRYCAFQTKTPPNELLSLFDEVQKLTKTSFEEYAKDSIKEFGSSWHSKSDKYLPNYNENYQYGILYNPVGGRSPNRTYYLYVMYFPNSNRLILIHENRQYPHYNLVSFAVKRESNNFNKS